MELKHVEKKVWPTVALLLLALVLIMFFSIIKASLFTHVDEEKRIFFEISFLFLAAVLASLLVSYTRQPLVMLLIVVGIVLSPSFIAMAWPAGASVLNVLLQQSPFRSIPLTPPKIVAYDEVVKALAQLGAIILLFKIGMHSEVKQIFSAKNFIVALLGVIVPFASGYYVGVAVLGYSVVVSLFLGAALTATSIGVSVAILGELNLLGKDYAKLLLGAAVIDDVLGLLALSFVVSYSTTTLEIGHLAEVAGKAVVFIAGGIIFGKIVVEKYFDKVKAENGTLFLSAMAFALFYAYAAEIIGLSGIVGAFLAGLALNYSKKKQELLEKVNPLESFLTPIFFISLGLLVEVNALAEFFYPIVLITIIAVLSKLVGCWAGARACGIKARDAVIVGVGMVPRGEVAFIIALYGLTMGVLNASEYSIITAMAFLTTVVTPPALKHLAARGEKK
ncbi:cation:proton antiporter [Candidatus Micrarchaeota archaeon]|nr:cation:proton antiporter [Candidatus Micrarchaeota archaeon]